MAKKPLPIATVTFDRIVGGGQAIGTLASGKKVLAWGVLPDETAEIQITKNKSSYAEGYAIAIQKPSQQRVAPQDPDSYLSTSPWQIMNESAEQHYKSALIEEAFELHDIVLPSKIETYSDGVMYHYRNKIEYSFWFDTELDQLSLAFFRRGTHGKVAIDQTSLATPAITEASHLIVAALNALHVGGRALKTLLIRSSRNGKIAWQLYVKDEDFPVAQLIDRLGGIASQGEIIFSNPKSPASVITKRLYSGAEIVLEDTILDVPFRYATEGFFQINLPIYEAALQDMRQWVTKDKPVVDMYSGVGTIGLTIDNDDVTLVEVNEHAVREMKRNIKQLHRSADTKAILAASENATDYITGDATIIVDPPRAGLHEAVITAMLDAMPERIVYLSCNPVTQARDVARLADRYGVRWHRGYNFFPRTPHIEHLIILDKK